MKQHSWLLSLLVVLFAGACGRSNGIETSGVVVRDSAGVQIVENVTPQWTAGEAWSLSAEPLIQIGVVDGETPYMFSQIRNPRRLADGSFIVIDGASREIRFFDQDGKHTRSIGREGGGPGEFSFPANLSVIQGDSLAVWDLVARRLTVFTAEGELGRVSTLAEKPESFLRPDFLQVFSNGDIFAAASPAQERIVTSATGEQWSMRSLVRFSGDGSNPVVLGSAEQVQCDPRNASECSFMGYGAVGVTVLQNDRIYSSRPDRNEIGIRDAEGSLVARIYGAKARQPITEATRSDFLNAVIAANPSRTVEVRAFVSEAAFAEEVPTLLSMAVSSDGYIWAQEYLVEMAPFGYPPQFSPRTEPVLWTVYDPEGRQLGDISAPVNFMVSEVGTNYVLGVWRDELGVERIQMYGLEKP